MLVGILTYHRSHNYGALLQAIALRTLLTKLGYEARFVDYWPKYHSQTYALIDWRKVLNGSIIDRIGNTVSTAINLPYRYSRIRKFKKFIKKHIIPYCSSTTELWDLIIYGSDQIWRRQPYFENRFNPEYFGAGTIKSKNYISYAPSMGKIDKNISELPELVKWLEKFNKISVREDALRKLLMTGGIENITTVLDPTLLMSKEDWSSLIGNDNKGSHSSKYLLVYELQNGSFDREAIKQYARKKNLEIKILRGEASKESYKHNTISVADPFDMVRLIRGAEIVFTSSYHGMVFSILFQRQFAASFLSNEGRADSLLRQIGLSERLVPPHSKTFPSSPIDFIPVMKRLRTLQDESIQWIREALSSIQTKQ